MDFHFKSFMSNINETSQIWPQSIQDNSCCHYLWIKFNKNSGSSVLVHYIHRKFLLRHEWTFSSLDNQGCTWESFHCGHTSIYRWWYYVLTVCSCYLELFVYCGFEHILDFWLNKYTINKVSLSLMLWTRWKGDLSLCFQAPWCIVSAYVKYKPDGLNIS